MMSEYGYIFKSVCEHSMYFYYRQTGFPDVIQKMKTASRKVLIISLP